MIKIVNRICSVCKNDKIEKSDRMLLRVDGNFEHVIEERCPFCRNLVYAKIKKVVNKQ